MKLRFKIKHLMYLSFWTAILMAIRAPLLESLPLIGTVIAWMSGIAGVVLFVGLYGIALFVEEGRSKDRTVTTVCNVLIGDLILHVIFTLVTEVS